MPGRLALCVLAILLAACAPSGEDPRSRLSVYEPPTHEYRVRYLEPPWERVRSDGTTVYLRIQSNAMMFGGFDAALPKYDLLVTVEAGSVDLRLDSDLSAAIADGETIVAGPRNIWTSDGVGGREFLTSFGSGSERQHRFVYFPIDGRVVRLAFEATPSLDTMELDEMIALTEIGE